MEKVQAYKSHTITLEAEHRTSGWICKYSIITLNPQNTRSYRDYTPATFSTEEEAEQVALQTAKVWIDNHPASETVR